MHLSLEDFVFIVDVAASLGISRLRITGGEPLTLSRLEDFVKNVSCFGIKDIAMTTNAQGLESRAASLKEAGVSRVNISLDSLQLERYTYLTRGGILQNALNGIDAALAAGMSPVKINCVVMGGYNDDEIENFALWTLHSPVHVRFIELMPFGEAADWPRSTFVSVRTIKQRLAGLGLVPTQVAGGGPADTFKLPEGLGSVGFISGDTEHFCGQCNRLRITSTGAIRACLFADVETSIAQIVKHKDKPALERAFRKSIASKPLREIRLATKRMAEIGG